MLKKNLGISLLVLLLGGVTFLLINQGQTTVNDVPKDVPIIKGKIVSTKTFRSDELKRGIEVVVEANLSLKEVAQYYNDEFEKRGIRAFGIPTFGGDSGELETSTEASGGGETSKHQQIMVYLRSEPPLTLVTISVLGNSMLFLPN